MATALLSAPPPLSHKTSLFQRPSSASFRSIASVKYPRRPTMAIPCSTTVASSSAEDEPTASPDGIAATMAAVEDPPFRGCKACGKEELEWGCNGEGRIQGGIATVPGFGWWPIKAYRPCPAFVASGGRYTRRGQSMDDVASGGGGRVSPVGTDDDS
ncbi:hypothetical protein GQ457_17G022510 [Hibiscus cannabinus]